MKSVCLFLYFLLINYAGVAQNDNYVARVPNSATPGATNTLVGPDAGNITMTGFENSLFGSMSGSKLTTGIQNVFIGAQTGVETTTGDFNTFLGAYSGKSNTSGDDNAFAGLLAGFANTTGRNNSFFGRSAGDNNTTGSNNIYLGYRANGTTGTLQNAVAIGANATVALNNAIVLGNYTNTSIAVGIGTNAPQYPLDVRGIINLRNSGTIKFSHLLNPNLRNGSTDQFLTVNELGETILARHRLRIDSVDEWSDKVFTNGYSLMPLTQVKDYIRRYGHLPGVPSAEDVVKEGVDLIKMNAMLLEKVEELTLYSIQLEKIDQDKQRQLDKQQAQIDELKRLVGQLLEKK